MKPLVTMQKTLIWLCICVDENPSSRWNEWVYIGFTVSILLSFVSVLIASVLFIVKFISVDLPESLSAFMQVTGWTLSFYMLFIALIMRKKLSAIFTGLAEIYDACKHFIIID